MTRERIQDESKDICAEELISVIRVDNPVFILIPVGGMLIKGQPHQ